MQIPYTAVQSFTKYIRVEVLSGSNDKWKVSVYEQ
jgi:hypothetical protein